MASQTSKRCSWACSSLTERSRSCRPATPSAKAGARCGFCAGRTRLLGGQEVQRRLLELARRHRAHVIATRDRYEASAWDQLDQLGRAARDVVAVADDDEDRRANSRQPFRAPLRPQPADAGGKRDQVVVRAGRGETVKRLRDRIVRRLADAKCVRDLVGPADGSSRPTPPSTARVMRPGWSSTTSSPMRPPIEYPRYA